MALIKKAIMVASMLTSNIYQYGTITIPKSETTIAADRDPTLNATSSHE